MTPYSWNAEDYKTHSTAQQGWAKELISKLQLKGDEHLLDIGCGDGKITAELAGALPGGQVVGIDLSREMIKLAKREFPPDKYPNLNFLQMDATAIDLPQTFDLAFSNAVLHWVKDHQAVLNRTHQALCPSGKVLFQMGGEGNAAMIIETIETMFGDNRWQRYFENFEFPYFFPAPAAYRQLLNKNGFEPLRVELLQREMCYPDREGLEGWIRTTWLPYTQRIPEKLRPDFIRECVDRYLVAGGQNNSGPVTVAMVRLEVEAIKRKD